MRTILNTIDHLGKFDGKSDEGFLVGSENQANKNAGPQDANQQLRSTAKDAGEAPNKHHDSKTDEIPVDKEDQVFFDELERLKRQEQDANDTAEALRKEFAQETKDLLLQAGAAKAQRHEGAVADFTNLEPVVNVSPIPTSRINSIHPSTLILGDQINSLNRSKVLKVLETMLLFYRNKKDERGVVFCVGIRARLVRTGLRQSLHKAPRAGIATLSTFLLKKVIQRTSILLVFKESLVYVITLEQILTLESKQGFRQFLAMQKEDHCGYFYYKRTEYVAALQSVVGSSRDSKLNVRHGFNFKTQKILIDNEVQYGIVKNQYITPKQSILP
ncbi:hypothetical protein Tco_0148867 [Tanacetum coccineum]